jgi:hypothetical protein
MFDHIFDPLVRDLELNRRRVRAALAGTIVSTSFRIKLPRRLAEVAVPAGRCRPVRRAARSIPMSALVPDLPVRAHGKRLKLPVVAGEAATGVPQLNAPEGMRTAAAEHEMGCRMGLQSRYE